MKRALKMLLALLSINDIKREQWHSPRIKDNERGNRKFNFLKEGDPYHAYYLHKVKDFIEGKAQEPAAPQLPAVPQQLQGKQAAPVSERMWILWMVGDHEYRKINDFKYLGQSNINPFERHWTYSRVQASLKFKWVRKLKTLNTNTKSINRGKVTCRSREVSKMLCYVGLESCVMHN